MNNTLPVEKLLGGRLLRVPDYQRGYAYADSFPRSPHRNAYLFRVSGSQDRALVHVTDSPKTVTAITRSRSRLQPTPVRRRVRRERVVPDTTDAQAVSFT